MGGNAHGDTGCIHREGNSYYFFSSEKAARTLNMAKLCLSRSVHEGGGCMVQQAAASTRCRLWWHFVFSSRFEVGIWNAFDLLTTSFLKRGHGNKNKKRSAHNPSSASSPPLPPPFACSTDCTYAHWLDPVQVIPQTPSTPSSPLRSNRREENECIKFSRRGAIEGGGGQTGFHFPRPLYIRSSCF